MVGMPMSTETFPRMTMPTPGQQQTLVGESIDVWRLCADRDPTAVATEITLAHVVEMKEQNIRFVWHH